MQFRFDCFCLDVADERLCQGERELPLTPKAFTLLRYLVEHTGRLLKKEDLLRAVWSDPLATDGSLHVCIRELRQALGDDARKPRFIETVHRRGYRFVGQLRQEAMETVQATTIQPRGVECESSGQPVSSSQPLVGREEELRQLEDWFEHACHGNRQIVFITGEVGIGKTALVDAFTERIGVDL
jgi:DNA-binding winged helix-turn-helix (wHTH) protein